MPIFTQDIKLLKSAVMADTSDGGGQMTGLVVVDGQSNNLFPDTSAMDRAFGRVNMRKVFGVAHTADTDTLLGAHAIMTDAPDDPLVHCTLLKTSGWSDERDAAKEAVEKYLVKGPRASVRIYDTHYEGSLQLRLITFVNGTFPSVGDAVVLVNPSGAEQYVRLLKVSVVNQQVALFENNSTVIAAAQVATCDLSSALVMDIFGPPAARIYNANGIPSEATFAGLYLTNVAGGAKFYGVKPLGTPGVVGDYSAITSGGIYTNLVPAATLESPLIDQFPLLAVPGLSNTALASITVSHSTTLSFGPNATITMPTLIEPRSLSLSHNGTLFTDNGKGELLQGTTVVGAVSYRTGTISLFSTSPSYGVANPSVSYRPATGSGASTYSDERMVTLANQGLVYVEALDPPPARGTFSMSYMAQGRWYMLLDDMDGKLSGAEPAYGVGTINYATGSVSVTLGAIPDIESPLIYMWGEKNIAQPFAAPLPTSAIGQITLSPFVNPDSVSLSWTRGGVAKVANMDVARVLSGDASGTLTRSGSDESLVFNTPVFPDGNVTATWQEYTIGDTEMSHVSGLTFSLANTPVMPSSLSFHLNLPTVGDFDPISDLAFLYDNGAGVLMARAATHPAGTTYLPPVAVGTVDYQTGAVVLTTTTLSSWGIKSVYRSKGRFFRFGNRSWVERSQIVQATAFGIVPQGAKYAGGLTSPKSVNVGVDYRIVLPASEGTPVAVSDTVFTLGGEIYTSKGGILRKGWAVGDASSVAAGSMTPEGVITLQSFPSNGSNVVVWKNVALSLASPTIDSGVFRTTNAPLKPGVFQLTDGEGAASNANAQGVLSGSEITGQVDSLRGFVTWSGFATDPAKLRYNAVFLQYLPLDAALLGLETARLPLDGKVPIYRTGDLVVVHNTLTTTLPNPLTKGVSYDLGRERIASVRVKDALGVVVPDTLYNAALNDGTIEVPVASNITAYTQPLTVEHRIEDMLLCSQVDISGQLKFTRSLTHNFPAGTSFVSSAMPFGDLFARVYNLMEQQTWTSTWSDALIGATIIPQFNSTLYPIVVTNAGAIKERWALIFTNTTSFRVIGESVGDIAIGNTSTLCAPINPATQQPYFSLPPLGWGSGWATGNVLRFNTDACGTPFWAVRTVLQGPASLDSDQFTLAFRGDVDRI